MYTPAGSVDCCTTPLTRFPVSSVNWIKSPCITNVVASPPNPVHSIYFLPLVPLKVKSVTETTSEYFSLLISMSAVNVFELPDPNWE